MQLDEAELGYAYGLLLRELKGPLEQRLERLNCNGAPEEHRLPEALEDLAARGSNRV